MKQVEPWNLAWRPLSHQPLKGGQGSILKVIHRSTGKLGALKQIDSARAGLSQNRARLAREVEALQRAGIQGVPQVLDHNMDAVDESDIPLYYVASWVEGPTLQQLAGGRPVGIDEALHRTRELASILADCHAVGVFHRDIKPDNLILDTEQERLFLVDFGAAYVIDSLAAETITGAGQELGNRFLRLPELSPGGNKRDMRADITFAVGMLFFLLTGVAPRLLLNENGLPPHEALRRAFPENIVKDPAWARVRRIFQVGFQPAAALRFQTTSALLQRIDDARTAAPIHSPDSAHQEEVNRLHELLETKKAESAIRIEQAIFVASRNLEAKLKAYAQGALLAVVSWAGSPRIVQAGQAVEFSYRLQRQDADAPWADLLHRVELTGDEHSMVSASYHLESEPSKQYYQGPAADTERLEEEMEKHSSRIFAAVVSALNGKLRAAFG